MEQEIEDARAALRAQVKLPGFRPGKIPPTSSSSASASRCWRTSPRSSSTGSCTRSWKAAACGRWPARGHRPQDRREPAADLPRRLRDAAPHRAARLQGPAGEGAPRRASRDEDVDKRGRPPARGGRALRSRRGPARARGRLRRRSTSPGTPRTAASADATRTSLVEVGADGQPRRPQRGARRHGARASTQGRRARLRRRPPVAGAWPAQTVDYTLTAEGA